MAKVVPVHRLRAITVEPKCALDDAVDFVVCHFPDSFVDAASIACAMCVTSDIGALSSVTYCDHS